MDRLRHLFGFADPDSGVDRDKSRHSGMLRHGEEPMAIWGSRQGGAEPEGSRKGVPGTGKTLVAGVVARELGLDLYRCR